MVGKQVGRQAALPQTLQAGSNLYVSPQWQQRARRGYTQLHGCTQRDMGVSVGCLDTQKADTCVLDDMS